MKTIEITRTRKAIYPDFMFVNRVTGQVLSTRVESSTNQGSNLVFKRFTLEEARIQLEAYATAQRDILLAVPDIYLEPIANHIRQKLGLAPIIHKRATVDQLRAIADESCNL